MLEFDRLPPSLRKVLSVWTEPDNWGKKLVEICKLAGVKYETARRAIWKVGTNDFYELKARLVDRAMLRHHDEVLKALAEKAKKGNTRAIEIYLKATGRLTEKVELSGGFNLNIVDKLVEAKKRAKEIERQSSE